MAELVATADKNAGLEGDGGWPDASSKVQAAVQFQHHTGPVVIKLFCGTETEKPDLLVHGEDDGLGPSSSPFKMAEAYRRTGLPIECVAVKHAGQDFAQVWPRSHPAIHRGDPQSGPSASFGAIFRPHRCSANLETAATPCVSLPP